MNILVAKLHAFCMEALLKAGVDPVDAETTANVLVTTSPTDT